MDRWMIDGWTQSHLIFERQCIDYFREEAF